MTKHQLFKPVYLIFLISPIIILFLGILYKSFIIRNYMDAVDPDYAYLFNGLNMARFDFKIYHIDHPGTPLQLICAVLIRIINLVGGKPELNNDVILHSGKYLTIISYFIIGLNSFGNLFMGISLYKITGKLFESVFLQFSPFIAFNLLSSLRRVSPEPLIVFNISMFVVAMIFILHNKQKIKHAIFLGLLVGWSIATKINAVFLILIPIFMFEGYKKKILFIGSSFVGFFLFAFPVIFRAEKFFLWIKNLTTHEGVYGSGAEKFIDIESFLNAMQAVFVKNILWTSLIIISGLILLMHFAPYMKTHFIRKKNIYYRTLIGLFFAWLLHLLIVGKHFAYRYMIPGLTLTFFTYYVALATINYKRAYTKNIFLSLPIIIFLIFLLPKYPSYVKSVKAVYEQHRESYEYYGDNIADKPTIFVPFYNGAPSNAYALYFGAWYSGPGEQEFFYNDKMKMLYPHTYLYKQDMRRIEWWREEITAQELMDKHKEIYLFVGDGRQNDKEKVLNLFNQISDSLEYSSVYFNPQTREEFIKINRTY